MMYGPETVTVEAFIRHLKRMTPEQWSAAADNNQETWQPISDAPTTGVRIVATNPLWPEDRRVRVVWWVEHGPSQDEGQYWQDDADSEPDPTLWQPLDTFATPVPRLTKALEENDRA